MLLRSMLAVNQQRLKTSILLPATGTSNWLTSSSYSALDIGTGNFTIEAFIYITETPPTSQLRTFVGKSLQGPSGWQFGITDARKLWLYFGFSTGVVGTASLSLNTWYYVAAVRSGTSTNQTSLYVNGVEDKQGAFPHNMTNTYTINIGKADAAGASFPFRGYISNVRISNQALPIGPSYVNAPLVHVTDQTLFLAANSDTLKFSNESNSFTNFTVSGSPSVSTFTPF